MGSTDRNRTRAGTFSKTGMRSSALRWSSTVVPYQTFFGGVPSHLSGTMERMFSGRLVNRSHSSASVRSTVFHRFSRHGGREG